MIPIQPGPHHLEVYSQWLRRYGQAALDVQIPPNAMVEVFYAPPLHQFTTGDLGFTPQQRKGIGCLVGLLVVLVAFVILVVLLAVLGSLLLGSAGPPGSKASEVVPDVHRAATEQAVPDRVLGRVATSQQPGESKVGAGLDPGVQQGQSARGEHPLVTGRGRLHTDAPSATCKTYVPSWSGRTRPRTRNGSWA